jgi:hypothetical protein
VPLVSEWVDKKAALMHAPTQQGGPVLPPLPQARLDLEVWWRRKFWCNSASIRMHEDRGTSVSPKLYNPIVMQVNSSQVPLSMKFGTCSSVVLQHNQCCAYAQVCVATIPACAQPSSPWMRASRRRQPANVHCRPRISRAGYRP